MDTFCSECRRIISDPGNDFLDHHRSFEDFQAAINNGCGLCGALWLSLSEEEKARLELTEVESPVRFVWRNTRHIRPGYLMVGMFEISPFSNTWNIYRALCFKSREGI